MGIVCTGCKTEKSEHEFRKDRAKPTGRNTRCKSCAYASCTLRYKKNRAERAAAIAAGEIKRCHRCGEEKPFDKFAENRESRKATPNTCQECSNKRVYAWRDNNPNKSSKILRKAHLWKKYKCTPDQALELLNNQDHRCAICMEPFVEDYHTCIDHNHLTGKIRGILCRGCNIGIGHLRENISILESAVHYLKSHEESV